MTAGPGAESHHVPSHIDHDAPVFVISVAAQLAGMHPQTLRTYDRMGLVVPRRTAKRGRRYSRRDVARLRLVQRLSQDEGVNLEGIRRILVMQDEIDELRARVSDLGAQLLDLVLHRDDPADPLEVDALVLGETLDQPQLGDVAGGVAAAPLGGAPRGHQPHPVVGAQRLRVHARELGRHGDDEDGCVVVDPLREL